MDEITNQTDPDIVEMDFPPYVEEYSPFPDVEADFNFEDNKEEIYRRNRIIAAKEQADIIKKEKLQKLERQRQLREMAQTAKAANAVNKKEYWDKLVLPASIITAFAIVLLIVVLSGRLSESRTNDMSFEESVNSMWFELEALRLEERMDSEETLYDTATTQVSKEPPYAETEIVITAQE